MGLKVGYPVVGAALIVGAMVGYGEIVGERVQSPVGIIVIGRLVGISLVGNSVGYSLVGNGVGAAAGAAVG